MADTQLKVHSKKIDIRFFVPSRRDYTVVRVHIHTHVSHLLREHDDETNAMRLNANEKLLIIRDICASFPRDRSLYMLEKR